MNPGKEGRTGDRERPFISALSEQVSVTHAWVLLFEWMALNVYAVSRDEGEEGCHSPVQSVKNTEPTSLKQMCHLVQAKNSGVYCNSVHCTRIADHTLNQHSQYSTELYFWLLLVIKLWWLRYLGNCKAFHHCSNVKNCVFGFEGQSWDVHLSSRLNNCTCLKLKITNYILTEYVYWAAQIPWNATEQYLRPYPKALKSIFHSSPFGGREQIHCL